MAFQTRRTLFSVVVGAILIVAGTQAVTAGPITYTQTGTATGSIGGT